MTAARAWAAGTLVAASPNHESEAMADARQWGASASELEGLGQLLSQGPVQPKIWLHNVAVVTAFCLAGTQWRTGLDLVDGRVRMVWIGLDYAGAQIAIEQGGKTITPELWTGLRIMEQAARNVFNGETVL